MTTYKSAYKTTTFVEDKKINVIHHATKIIEHDVENNTITLNNGGWYSKTTKDRINAYAYENNLPFRVYQKDFEWFVTYDNKCYPFEDNMIITKWVNVVNVDYEPINADEKETKRYYKNIVTQNEGR